MDKLDIRVQELVAKMQDFFASQPVQKAWLFGSFSRGEQTEESDVDILAFFDDDFSLFDHARMMLQLEKLLGRSVDLVTEGTLYPFAEKTANEDKILIYERPAA